MAYDREVDSPLLQKSGNQIIKVNVETIATQVKMLDKDSNPSDVDTEIQNLWTTVDGISNVQSGAAEHLVVSTLADRNSLVSGANTLPNGSLVWVKDASADSTVDSGAALYVWDFDGTNGTWIKLSEAEAFTENVVVDWSDIQNGPTASVSDIDQAATVADSIKSNYTSLAKVGENASGKMTYGGKPVGEGGSVVLDMPADKSDAEYMAEITAQYPDLPDGAFITIIDSGAGGTRRMASAGSQVRKGFSQPQKVQVKKANKRW